MAKWKEPTTEVVTIGVDPRARMKEIRAEVSAYLKGDTLGLAHLGDLPDNMEDARRVIIAVQDLLDTEREKHRKATAHICELIHLNDEVAGYNHELMMTTLAMGNQIRNLVSQIDSQAKHINALGGDMQQAQRERDAVLTTMKLMNGQPAQAGYNAARPLPMMALGLGSKDRT